MLKLQYVITTDSQLSLNTYLILANTSSRWLCRRRHRSRWFRRLRADGGFFLEIWVEVESSTLLLKESWSKLDRKHQNDNDNKQSLHFLSVILRAQLHLAFLDLERKMTACSQHVRVLSMTGYDVIENWGHRVLPSRIRQKLKETRTSSQGTIQHSHS